MRTSTTCAPMVRMAWTIDNRVPPVEITSSTKTSRSPLWTLLMNMSVLAYAVVCLSDTSPGSPYFRFRIKTYGLRPRRESAGASGNPIARPLEDVRLAFHMPVPHQDDAVADRGVDHATVGGIDPIAHVVVAGGQFRAPRIDQDEVREVAHADCPGLDPEGPRASPRREFERLHRRKRLRVPVRELLQERGHLHRFEHVEAV